MTVMHIQHRGCYGGRECRIRRLFADAVFWATGTDADSICGSLDLGSEYVYLDDGNTYTVKGRIISGADSVPRSALMMALH